MVNLGKLLGTEALQSLAPGPPGLTHIAGKKESMKKEGEGEGE